MSDQLIPVSVEWAKRAFADDAKYHDLYQASVGDPVAFWREQGKRIDWIKPYTKVKDVSYDAKNLFIRWYEDGALNVSAKGMARLASWTCTVKVLAGLAPFENNPEHPWKIESNIKKTQKHVREALPAGARRSRRACTQLAPKV